jgi:hypothetical protein
MADGPGMYRLYVECRNCKREIVLKNAWGPKPDRPLLTALAVQLTCPSSISRRFTRLLTSDWAILTQMSNTHLPPNEARALFHNSCTIGFACERRDGDGQQLAGGGFRMCCCWWPLCQSFSPHFEPSKRVDSVVIEPAASLAFTLVCVCCPLPDWHGCARLMAGEE